MYHHRDHAMCSSVTLTKLAFLAKIEEGHNYVERQCVMHKNHYNLLPYFVGDYELEKIENVLKERGDNSGASEVNVYRRKAMLRDTKHYATEFSENDWTQRLHRCLEYPGYNIMYTATLGTRQMSN